MNRTFRLTVLVMMLTLVGQVINFITQMVVAYLYGANASMDAYNAAIAFPQYINVTLLGSLGFVFLPVFVNYLTSGKIEDAWHLASSVINLCIVLVGVIILAGMFAPDLILNLIVPGLSKSTQQLASQLSVVLWPSVLATGLTILLTSIYYSETRFGWPSFVPILGASFGLLLTVFLAKNWGIFGLAYGTTAGAFLQLLLLAPIAFQSGRYKFTLGLTSEGVRQVFRLLGPLLLASIFGKATGLVERYLASSMSEGTISHLSYALRIVNMISLLISSGVSAVLFQQMAVDASSRDLSSLRRTISMGIRYLWLAVAPMLTLGFALSLPLVVIVFQRGEFSQEDAVSVSNLLQIYMLSLAASCFGNITARAFYVLGDTVTVAWMGGVESIAYVLYTALLARWYGPLGIALGYVLLFNGSLGWQSLIISAKTGKIGGISTLISLLRTAIPAVIGGVVAWGTVQYVANKWLQIVVGGSLGGLAYLTVLLALRSPEGWNVARLLVNNLKFRNVE